MAEHHAGRLLVATPGLLDPNFFRTVVLVLEHDVEGALGIVLNRPSETAVAAVVPEWADAAAEPLVVFVGGPVGAGRVIGLARCRASTAAAADGWAPLFSGLGTVDLGRPPDAVTPEVSALRVFAGYAGWGAGQLDAEIASGSWFVVDGGPDDVTAATPEGLWRAVLLRQRGRLAWFANCPPNPATN